MNTRTTRYAIVVTPADMEAGRLAATYSVAYTAHDNNEYISHHESYSEAKAAIKRYEAADKRRGIVS